MKYLSLFVMALVGFVLVSCGNNENATPEESSAEPTAEENSTPEETTDYTVTELTGELEYFGDTITTAEAQSVAVIPTALEGKDSVYLKVQGTITSVCQKKGCWMTLAADEEEEVFTRFVDYGFFVPLNAEGRQAVMEGWAYRSVTSVEELRHYAEDEGKSEEEIAAITEPKEEFTFMANGVAIQ